MKSVFITEGLKSLNAEFQAASPEASDPEKVGIVQGGRVKVAIEF